MTMIDAYVSHCDKPYCNEWIVRHGFALALAGCLAFWSIVAIGLYHLL